MSIEEILSNNPIAIDANNRPKEFCHLLNLCHMYFRPSQKRDPHARHLSYSGRQSNKWHRAEQYYTAGAKFEKRELNDVNPHSLLDVRFSDDVIHIPYIFIDEVTVIIFKNLIVLEQTNPQFGNDVMAYVVFISQLVTNVQDVSLLVSKGIIGHQSGSNEEVLKIILDASESIVFNFDGEYYLRNIHQTLEEYYESRIKFWGRWLCRFKATPG